MHGRGATNLLIAEQGSGVGVYKMVGYGIHMLCSNDSKSSSAAILQLSSSIMYPHGTLGTLS